MSDDVLTVRRSADRLEGVAVNHSDRTRDVSWVTGDPGTMATVLWKDGSVQTFEAERVRWCE